MLLYSQKNFAFQKLSCLTFLPRLINKRLTYFFFFFFFTIIISDPRKSYFKNWNNIPYSQRCFTFLSIFHLSRFGCTTSFSLSFNKPRENLNSRMKRYLTVSSIQYRYLFRIRGKRFHRFVPIFPPVKHREDGRRTRFEARNLAGSRIA